MTQYCEQCFLMKGDGGKTLFDDRRIRQKRLIIPHISSDSNYAYDNTDISIDTDDRHCED